eukprot:TRINITY_DN8125_c0_g1_i1.p1 TRINITY_DN8125_c0_g1~~TRINITY_DN8125_c0_g1_i1.p1  ORF type:complete len:495 (-),score=121.30 TRINITY_DN8125_c0_g1_i1:35-1519(-)
MLGARIYSDAEFVPTAWQSKPLKSPVVSGVDPLKVNLKYDSMILGGNPGSYSRLEIKAERDYLPDFDEIKKSNLPSLKVLIAHLSLAASFDPSINGEIHHIDFYCDLNNMTLMNNPSEVSINYSILLLQKGVLYHTTSGLCIKVIHKRWTGYTLNHLRATHFVPIHAENRDMTTKEFKELRPDFSENGDVISFGYLVHASSPHSFTSTSGIDNWKVTVIHKHSSKHPNSTDFEEISRKLSIETLERQRMERQLYKEKLDYQHQVQSLQLALEQSQSEKQSEPKESKESKDSPPTTVALNRSHESLVNIAQKKMNEKDEKLLSEKKLVEELQQKNNALELNLADQQNKISNLIHELEQVKTLLSQESQSQHEQQVLIDVHKEENESFKLEIEALKRQLEEEVYSRKKAEGEGHLEKSLREKIEKELKEEQIEKEEREERNKSVVEELMKEGRRTREEVEGLKEMLEREIELRQSAEDALKKLENIFYVEEGEESM